MEGRIEGKVNGATYELWQFGELRMTLPITEANKPKFLRTISRNKWERP